MWRTKKFEFDNTFIANQSKAIAAKAATGKVQGL